MGCGCGGKKVAYDPTAPAGSARTGFASPTDAGMYELASAPSCTESYRGMFRQATVYVVGLGVAGEKLFVRGDYEAARLYARQTRLRLYHLPAASLCNDAMLELLGA